MKRLSSTIDSIKARYDVIVVGSGYGGAITASRLSRAGKSVCVLERGMERQPGEYPDTTLEGAAEMQFDHPAGHVGPRTGMFDFRINPEISVLVGSGLGGTSLINAGVALRPDPRVLADACWPEALRREQGKRMERGYSLAEQMLGSNPLPAGVPLPPKVAALKRSAEHMGHRFFTPPINVTFTAGRNHAGVAQPPCTLCGDCVSGCNNGSKNTVLMNYLPDAHRHGAEIFVEVGVRRVERTEDGTFRVHYQALHTGREAFDAPLLFVSADIVILAAGSLGSTEILMRSRREGGLTVSDRLGEGFSGNGDVLAFGYNTDAEIRGVGFGYAAPQDGGSAAPEGAVGTTILGIIDMRDTADWRAGMIIAEGAAPGLMGAVLPPVHKASAELGGVNTALERELEQRAREAESAIRGAYHGATKRTQTYLGMCHDGSNGAMRLEDDRLRIAWPGIGDRPVIQVLNDRLREATVPLRGIAVNDPIWNSAFGKSLITVHPLGGCNMANTAEGGVVDHACKVFSSSAGTAVHEGLYVCDGSIVPTSLGVNPLLTISALAERCCMIIAEERGLTIDYGARGPLDDPGAAGTVGIRFTESMKGWFSAGAGEDYARAAQQGEEEGSSFEFVLTIATDDVDAMIERADHRARMVGTVTAPRLSPEPLSVARGVFNLFVQDPSTPDVRHMLYHMVLSATDGRRFHLSGFKTIRRGSPFWHAWHDCSTLYITIREGETEAGPVVGTGILRISPADLIRLLSTVDPTHASSALERLGAVVKFGRNFAGVVFDFYGGVSAPAPSPAGRLASLVQEAEARPRKRRPLRARAPELVAAQASDGVDLVLTRHRGGAKGPVILAHGVGTSSRMFSTDTLGTNLLELLFAHGYDVWLFDHRAGTRLSAPPAPPTAEDVAHRDWPAAIAAVLATTGAASAQVVAHDLGALTLSMALLSGLRGVRSAVCSQVATHVIAPAGPIDWVEHLYERAEALVTGDEGEACGSDVCKRLTSMYGPLFEHAQLDPITHASLHELFEDASPALGESLAAMARAGHVVTTAGDDVYLPHLDRMAIPIRFLHGAENHVFLPASTEAAMAALAQVNGAGLYSRVVLPGYGHEDCILGKNAATEVYPAILEHLEEGNAR